jgi:hypothetical protein
MANYFNTASSDTVRVTDGTDTLAVNAAGGITGDFLGYLAENGTKIDGYTNGTGVVMYTVPAGKKAYILGVTGGAPSAVTELTFRTSGGATEYYMRLYGNANYMFYELTAGQTIYAGSTSHVSFFGYEVEE